MKYCYTTQTEQFKLFQEYIINIEGGKICYYTDPSLSSKYVAIINALEVWAIPTAFIFERVTDPKQACIKFYNYTDSVRSKINAEHNYEWGYDINTTLGAALITGPKSDMYGHIFFNPSIDWNKYSFLGTAIHEIGHILGIKHTDKPGNVMLEYYTPQETLGRDDMAAAIAVRKRVLPDVDQSPFKVVTMLPEETQALVDTLREMANHALSISDTIYNKALK